MRKFKIIVVLVVLGLIALIGFQNRDFVLLTNHFGINLLFYHYQSPPIPNFALMIAFFMAGLLLAYFSTLVGRFKTRRTIKDLNGQVASFREQTAALEKELADLKVGSNTVETTGGNAETAS